MSKENDEKMDEIELKAAKVKLEYNQKLLTKAESDGDEEAAERFRENVKHYEEMLKSIK